MEKSKGDKCGGGASGSPACAQGLWNHKRRARYSLTNAVTPEPTPEEARKQNMSGFGEEHLSHS